MIPAYKVILYTSIGSSMYMMGRLVLVRCSTTRYANSTLTSFSGTQDLVWQELSDQKHVLAYRREWERVDYRPQCTNSQQSLNQWHRFPLFCAVFPPSRSPATAS